MLLGKTCVSLEEYKTEVLVTIYNEFYSHNLHLESCDIEILLLGKTCVLLEEYKTEVLLTINNEFYSHNLHLESCDIEILKNQKRHK